MHWTSLIKPEQTFNVGIDLACHNGTMCRALVQRRQTSFKNLYGVDCNSRPFPAFEKWGVENNCNVVTQAASIAFDIVGKYQLEPDFIGSKSAFYVIHLNQVRAALENVAKTLTEDGVFLFAQSFINMDSVGPGCFRHKWNRQNIQKLLEECGLTEKTEVLEIIESSDKRYFHVVGGPQERLEV